MDPCGGVQLVEHRTEDAFRLGRGDEGWRNNDKRDGGVRKASHRDRRQDGNQRRAASE